MTHFTELSLHNRYFHDDSILNKNFTRAWQVVCERNTEIHPEVGKNQRLNTGLLSSKEIPFG
jgi:hypothetical protein